MAIKLLDAVTAASVTKSSKSVRGAKGSSHIVDCSFNSTTAVEISALTIKLQGAETNNNAETGLVTNPGLSIGSTAENVANIQFDYRIKGVHYTKAAVAAGTALSAATNIAASNFGGFIVQIDSGGVVTTKVPSATQTYASMALANAAVDALEADGANVKMGKVLIANNADAGGWDAVTDDMTDGSDVTTATFVSSGSEFTDLATHVFTADELTNNRAIFQVDVPSSWVRLYMSALTGTGEITGIYTGTEGY